MRLLTLWLENKYIFNQFFVRGVWGPFIWENPSHAGLPSGVDKQRFGIFRNMTTQSNDQCILASECLNECLWFAVIDLFGNYAFREFALAVSPRDRRNGVFSSPKQGCSHEAAAVATSLCLLVGMQAVRLIAYFYARQRWQPW